MHVLPVATDHRRTRLSDQVSCRGDPRNGNRQRALRRSGPRVDVDDDTFTIDKPRAIEIAKGMKKLKLTWSCNARAHLDYETLRQLRDNGLRLLLVGFESGNQ